MLRRLLDGRERPGVGLSERRVGLRSRLGIVPVLACARAAVRRVGAARRRAVGAGGLAVRGARGRGSGLRPVAPDGLHVTLCFLGSRPAADDPVVASACSAVASGLDPGDGGVPLLAIDGALWLPRRRPRVLGGRAVRRRRAPGAPPVRVVLGAVAPRRVHAPERRPFLPHVTVARVRRRAGGLNHAIRPRPAAARVLSRLLGRGVPLAPRARWVAVRGARRGDAGRVRRPVPPPRRRAVDQKPGL